MRDTDIQVSFPRDIFVKLVNLLDRERTNLEYFLKSPSTTEGEMKRYQRELYDVKSMLG